MNKQLAIIGHETRGAEVIGILETLGAINKEKYIGNDPDALYVLNDECIDLGYDYDNREVYTLEQFLRKYPFKIGDRVINGNFSGYGIITEMIWDSNKYCVIYCVKFEDFGIIAWLKYNEIKISNICRCKDDIDSHEMYESKLSVITIDSELCKDEVEIVLNDYEIVTRDGKKFAVKKKPKYPTTYEECCGVLGTTFDYPDIRMVSLDEYYLYSKFIQLIRCRNAYWKIAGEQMGLGKPWEPTMETVYCISRNNNVIKCSYRGGKSNILEFPTKEMRDDFYKNFKDLIEDCKELL